MAVIRLSSHAPSDTIQRLKASLTEAGHNVKKLKQNGTYQGRAGHVVFNYGNSGLSPLTIGAAQVLNHPSMITRASNKREAFTLMERGHVRTVEYTTQRQIAEQWIREGMIVYARTRLQGHSGEGIALCYANPANIGDAGGMTVHDHVVNAPLYTKGVLGNRREYRVHVFKGKIIHVAQKRRRDGFNDIPEHNNLVRNWHTGWVYSTQNMTALNHSGQCEALKAVDALGLDFGAVDIITNREQAWVLEVNTAPGMEGVTLDKYVAAISAVAENEEVEGTTVENYAFHRQVAEPVDPNASDRTPAQRRQGNRAQPQEQTNAVNTASQRTGNVAAPERTNELEQMQQQQAAAQSATPRQAGRQTAPAASQASSNATQQPVSQPAANARNNNGSHSLVDGGHYWLTINGESTIGKFNRNVNSFEIIGWEVPVDRDEAVVGARITN